MAISPAHTLPSKLRLPKRTLTCNGVLRFNTRQWQSETATATSLRLGRKCVTRMFCHPRLSLDFMRGSISRSEISKADDCVDICSRLVRVFPPQISGRGFTYGPGKAGYVRLLIVCNIVFLPIRKLSGESKFGGLIVSLIT